MTFDFDQRFDIPRFGDSVKWCIYDEDVLPLWVADMDFRSPEAVTEALRERVELGIYGYAMPPAELTEVIQDRLERLYGWQVKEDEILFIPGVVSGFNQACLAVGEPGDAVLVEPPIYPPMLTAPENTGRLCRLVQLAEGPGGYQRDLAAFAAAAAEATPSGGQASILLLCNPHNPTGRVFDRDELEALAEICLRHEVVICSDEIHGDIVFSGHEQIPIATLSPEVAQQTITLFAPSKTFNIPGLSCSVGVIQNPELRERYEQAGRGIVPHVNLMGYTAALAAYRDGGPWLEALLVYLEQNRNLLLAYLAEQMPSIRCHKPESTFLAWLDCRQAGISGNPHTFFLEQACVALVDGEIFGPGGEGFVRLNFTCPRATLLEALERMREPLQKLESAVEREN